MGNTETINAYSYQIKAFESEGDFIHGDYVILNQFYIPSENLSYHFHQNFLIVNFQQQENYEEYLKVNNINKSISYDDEQESYDDEDEQNKIYNLKEVKLKVEFVIKLKEYYELDKQRKKLYDEIMICK